MRIAGVIRRVSGLLLLCCAAWASAPAEYSRRIWRSEDGLPQNKIQVISQTHEGYLWVGTSGGLARFDGARFVVFDRSNTPALREDSILSLCPARDGSLWIGTEGGGLVRLRNGAFENFGPDQGLTNGFVRALAEDREGRLWVGSDRGFFRFRSGRLIRLDDRGDIPILATRSIYQDREGLVRAGTNRGLFTVADERMQWAQPAYEATGYIWSMVEATDGTLWLASESSVHGLLNGRLVESPKLRDIRATAITEDSDGDLWIGTSGEGLVRVRKGALNVYRAGDTLPDNSVSAIFQDRERSLWVGTQDGLLRLSRTTVRTITSKDGLADDNVATVYEDPSGDLWIGTLNGELYQRHGQDLIRFRGPRSHPSPERFRAQNIYVDGSGVRWIGSISQGFLRSAGNDMRVFTTQDGLRSNDIRDFYRDRRGVTWIATGSGLSSWDGHSIRTLYLENGLPYGSVRVLAPDRNGDILVGTDGGIGRLRGDAFIADPTLAAVGNERVWSILSDSSGTLWLGTRGNGLIRIADGKLTRYTTKDGLPGNSLYQILADGENRLWLSSSTGVFAVDRSELDAVARGRPGPVAVVPYGTDDGMPSGQMNGGMQRAGCLTASGRLWFPGVKGAVEIDPSGFRPSPSSPVLIESVLAGDKPVAFFPGMTIPAGRGRLEFEFTSPNLLSPGRVTFEYKLENFDDAWTSSRMRRAAYYTNLPPGRYQFHVIARDGARQGRISDAILPFVLEPHFYETTWFYGAIALIAALGIWAAFGFYARLTKARYALVLGERTRLAREMHDTVIQGCAGASSLLEAARSMPPGAGSKVRELLDQAARQIRLTVNEAREAVWDLRHSTIEQSLAVTLEDFARQISLRTGIPVRTDIEGAPTALEDQSRRNLVLVAREAIRNAVTHARPAKIDVVLRFEAAVVLLEVSDNGMGFSPESTREGAHYGITGMRERVEQSGGRFEVRSSPGQGTRVIAKLPLKVRHTEDAIHG